MNEKDVDGEENYSMEGFQKRKSSFAGRVGAGEAEQVCRWRANLGGGGGETMKD